MRVRDTRLRWWLPLASLLVGCDASDSTATTPESPIAPTSIAPADPAPLAPPQPSLGVHSSTPSSTRPIAPRPSVDDPSPWFWLTTSCIGECPPRLPDGLPEVVVYPNAEYLLTRPTDPLSVFSGQLSADELAEFETLLAATGIAHDTSYPTISLGTSRPTEPTDGYFTARVGTRAVRQTVEDLWSQAEAATDERRPYEHLAAWIDRLGRTIPEDAWGTGDR